VLVETLWVLDAVYARSAQQIGTAVEMLLSHAELNLQDADVAAVALAQFPEHPGLGFSDCLILATAQRAGHLLLGSFDRQPTRLEGNQRLRPSSSAPARRTPEVFNPASAPAAR
jgi:predicted nucleic-acid-binding protein